MGNLKILVTGGRGQLGSALREILDARLPGATEYLDLPELDITDASLLKGVMTSGRYTHVVNCAAYTAVDRAETDKSLCRAVNVDGVKNLAMSAAETGCKLLHISTDYVFDGGATTPYTEGDKVNPLSLYGSTKRKGETALLALDPEAIILRSSWLYSPYGSNFVKTMLRLACERQEPHVVYDQVGTPTYALDLAEAICAILTAKAWTPGIYNYSNEGVASWYDFAQAIFDIAFELGLSPKTAARPVLSAEYPRPAERPHYSVLDKARIKATYGLDIRHWREALRDCLGRIAAESALEQ